MIDLKTYVCAMAMATLKPNDPPIEVLELYNQYLAYDQDDREKIEETLRDKMVANLHITVGFYNDSEKTSNP